jgi:uncharacterized protein YecE (DUF72 family)
MGEIRVGTASWTDKTLIASGWYPQEANTAEKRLRYYARQFPLVEVDSTYYGLPAEQTAAMWAQRTPPGFIFNIKAFSLFTQHPTPVGALPAGLREAAERTGKARVYLKDVAPEVTEQAWDRFLAALEPLRKAGKLGPILLQFPPWFPISRASKDYYTDDELDEWAAKVRGLAGETAQTHVVFNNCYRDYAQVNARRLTERLNG